MHVVAQAQSVAHFVEHKAMQGLTRELFELVIRKIAHLSGRNAEKRVARHDGSRVATVHGFGQ